MPPAFVAFAFLWGLIEITRRSEVLVDVLGKLGLTLNRGIVLFETKRLNDFIGGDRRENSLDGTIESSRVVHIFYVVGTLVFAATQCFLIIYLLCSAIASLYGLAVASSGSGLDEASHAAAIRPMIPGYNAPSDGVPALALALLISLAFHELGHGIAASTERVRTEGAGVFIAIFMPGAFVRLEEGLLPQLPPRVKD